MCLVKYVINPFHKLENRSTENNQTPDNPASFSLIHFWVHCTLTPPLLHLARNTSNVPARISNAGSLQVLSYREGLGAAEASVTTPGGPRMQAARAAGLDEQDHSKDHSAAPGLGEMEEAVAGLGSPSSCQSQEARARHRARRLKGENVLYELEFPPQPSENVRGGQGCVCASTCMLWRRMARPHLLGWQGQMR